MPKRNQATPTKGEIEILQILWKNGASTVRAVHQQFGRETGYTTILKMLQIMTEKGLVERDEVGRAHVYKARISEKGATSDFVGELIQRLFGGSPVRLAMQALGQGKPTADELAEIRQLIDDMEGKKRK